MLSEGDREEIQGIQTVLILVLVDHALGGCGEFVLGKYRNVLILVLVDHALGACLLTMTIE